MAAAQIDRVLEQVIERMFERAGQQLLSQIDRNELRLRVDLFVASHGHS